MYHWVEDKDFLTRAYHDCADLVNQLVQELKNYGIDARMNVVGSKKRNMITQNGNQPIDFDFNLLIENSNDFPNERDLKEDIREAFNEVLSVNGWDDCDDSTSALTTKQMVFKKGNKTPFSIDVCIVKQDCYGLHRLIHRKTGIVAYDQWYWNLVPNSQDLWEKENVTVGQLGNILHLDAGTLTPLLKHLEKDGYISRERSKEDERITIISITKKGNALKEKCKDIPHSLAKEGSPLSEKEVAELYRLLYKFLEEK